jgi:ribosome-associated protein
MKTKEIINIATEIAREKKAENIITLDMRGLSSIADYFFFCSAENTRQVKAIVEEISVQLKKSGAGVKRTEGLRQSRWVVMDCGDVLLHIFLAEAREYYSLESLWGDAPQLIFSAEKQNKTAKIKR